jgi:hypothetical protein
MQVRPRDWGLAFSPTAKADALELAKITGGSLLPSDWMFPPNSQLATDLKAFFQKTSGISYYQEAAANLQALLKKQAIPLRFAGYVNLDQTPQLLANPPANVTLWGCNLEGQWSALYTLHDGQAAPTPGAPEPARLTPLVYTDDNAAGAP